MKNGKHFAMLNEIMTRGHSPGMSEGLSGAPHRSTDTPSITSSKQADEPADFLEPAHMCIGVLIDVLHDTSRSSWIADNSAHHTNRTSYQRFEILVK